MILFCSNLGQDVEKAHENKGSLAVLRGVSESGLEDIRLNLGLFPLILALFLFMSVSSWGACQSITAFYGTAVCDCSVPTCPTRFEDGYYYTGATLLNLSICRDCNYINCRSYGCPSSGYVSYGDCRYEIRCTTQEEADSLYCVLNPNDENCIPQCDSTNWTCNTETETTQTTIESTNIVCYGDNCFGTPYCEYITKSTTTCRNECGQITTGESEAPIRYEGRCNDDNLLNDDYCTEPKCNSFDGTYHLYKMCASREIINGQQQFLPRFVGGGKGDCANAGYSESSFDNSNTQVDSISNNCFMYGVGCPNKDTTNYNESDNRNPSNCFCEPLDGQSFISSIVCPDGSHSTFYGSCDQWQDSFSSSSTSPFSSSSTESPPESSSSGSENPPTSSGGVNGDWTTYAQGEDIKAILGVIAQRVGEKSNISNSINLSLDDYSTTMDNSEYVGINRSDSVYNPEYGYDTSGLAHAIFHKLDSSNKILDTLHHVNGVCPCITFFSGNSQTSFTSGHITFKEIQFDMSDIKGYNLCTIISTIVVALASIVSFFIGFSIFKNASA